MNRKTDKVGIALLGLFLILLLSSLYTVAYGRVTDLRSDIVTEDANAVDNVAVHVSFPALAAATSSVLVDLSDTTNFPHKFTGDIEISHISVNWLAASTLASSTVKFGVFASTTATGANSDVYWFDSVSLSGGEGLSLNKVLYYAPSVASLELSSGEPVKFATNDSSLYSTTFATTTKLQSIHGTAQANLVIPAVGDLIMYVSSQVGTVDLSVTVFYRTR